ncbi:MAG TPA: right-handed parallel beta-helix repeat-containing protein [Gaiellaceae bacterium]
MTHISAAVLLLCGFAGFLVVPSNRAAAAATCSFYASPSGSDSANGSSSAPFATVTKLVTTLTPGETGCLNPGTYVGDVSIYHGGQSGAPIGLTSTDPASPATIKGRLVTFGGADWVTFSQLVLDGVNATGLPSPTVGSQHVTFSHVDVTNEHTAICFDLINSSQWGVSNYVTIDASRIHDCGRLPFGSTNNDHGIYAAGFNATITNNYIYDNTDRGVQLRGSQGAVVQHNVIDGNGEGVIFGDLSASNNDVSYNVVSNSVVRSNAESWWGSTPVGTGNSFHDNCVWASNSNAYYNSNGGISLTGGGFAASANKIASPAFVNAAAANFSLGSASGCAGYGLQAGVTPGVTGSGSTPPPPTNPTPPPPTNPTPPPPPPPAPSPAPPVATAPPTISGTPVVGATLSAAAGQWTGASGFQYTWFRCGRGCTPIPGASGASYRVTWADRNTRLRVTVIAQNAAGSTAASSAPTATVRSGS